MLYLITAVGSWSCGFIVACGLGVALKSRLSKRLAGVRATLEAIRELENRRVGTEMGRDHLVRATAGRPAKVADGFRTKPGSLARAAQDERPSNK